jgi:hypothetical protein
VVCGAVSHAVCCHLFVVRCSVVEAQRTACRRRLHQLHGITVSVHQSGATGAFDFQVR